MIPKEKAKELLDKMYFLRRCKDGEDYIPEQAWIHAKQCALIAVDEIISSREEDGAFNDTISYTGSEYYTPHPMYLTYWKQVKQEIESL